jgi:hypothetical protein
VVSNNGWAVKKAGFKDPLFESETKKPAIQFATQTAKATKGELFVHGQDGKIKSRNSYGNDGPGRG